MRTLRTRSTDVYNDDINVIHEDIQYKKKDKYDYGDIFLFLTLALGFYFSLYLYSYFYIN